MKKALLTFWVAILLSPVVSQVSGYNIRIQIEAYPDSIAYMGNYYGDQLYVADTAIVVGGEMIFTGSEPLEQGVYFLVSGQRKKLFEFLVDEDQVFSLSTKFNGSSTNMQINGSEENLLFYDYLNHNKLNYDRMKDIQTLKKNLSPENDSIRLLEKQIDSINAESISYKLEIMAENPDALTTLLFNVMREPDISDFFKEDGRQDSSAAYLYYRNHYWDDISFSDDRILRTPVFHRKLERYMQHVIPKHPDSLIAEIDRMISLTEGNTEMTQYLLWYFTNTYETSKVMGYDKIFVHMVDDYFTDQTYDWLNTTVQQNMINRANSLRNVLLGEFAPSIIMADTNNEFIALHQIDAEYMIVLFWVSSCGECKREVSILKNYYLETDLDLKIYAVNTDTTLSNWKNYLKEKKVDWIHVNGNLSLTGDYHDLYDIYSTPVIYILDRDKKIIAKRLAAEKIPEFLRRINKNGYE